MNKLAERIRHARRRGNRRLGFGLAQDPQAASRGLLIAARGRDANGADLVILADLATLDATAPAAASDLPATGGTGDALIGVAASPLTASGAEQAGAAGAAFVVYDAQHADADALLREKLDFVLQLPERATPDRALEDAELRAVSTLRPALVIGPAVTAPMSVAALIDLRRTALTVGAPLAVAIPADTTSGLLEVLRDSGVVVLILDAPSAEQVSALRARIAELPVSPRRRDDDSSPVVSGVRAEADDPDDDFDDD